jgi:hypothetical protein
VAKPRLVIGLSVGALMMMVPVKASAVCPAVGYIDVDHFERYQGAHWVRRDYSSSSDLAFSTLGTVYNTSTTSTQIVLLPLLGSFQADGVVHSLSELTAAVYVGTPTEGGPQTTCTLRAYTPTFGYVVSDGYSTSCDLFFDLSIAAYAVSANVRCTLPTRTATVTPEITRTTSATWYW